MACDHDDSTINIITIKTIWEYVPYLSASEVMIHEKVLYHLYLYLFSVIKWREMIRGNSSDSISDIDAVS